MQSFAYRPCGPPFGDLPPFVTRGGSRDDAETFQDNPAYVPRKQKSMAREGTTKGVIKRDTRS